VYCLLCWVYDRDRAHRLHLTRIHLDRRDLPSESVLALQGPLHGPYHVYAIVHLKSEVCPLSQDRRVHITILGVYKHLKAGISFHYRRGAENLTRHVDQEVYCSER
jgi:hypothetical protein